MRLLVPLSATGSACPVHGEARFRLGTDSLTRATVHTPTANHQTTISANLTRPPSHTPYKAPKCPEFCP